MSRSPQTNQACLCTQSGTTRRITQERQTEWSWYSGKDVDVCLRSQLQWSCCKSCQIHLCGYNCAIRSHLEVTDVSQVFWSNTAVFSILLLVFSWELLQVRTKPVLWEMSLARVICDTQLFVKKRLLQGEYLSVCADSLPGRREWCSCLD